MQLNSLSINIGDYGQLMRYHVLLLPYGYGGCLCQDMMFH